MLNALENSAALSSFWRRTVIISRHPSAESEKSIACRTKALSGILGDGCSTQSGSSALKMKFATGFSVLSYLKRKETFFSMLFLISLAFPTPLSFHWLSRYR